MKDPEYYKLEFHPPILNGEPCPYVVVEGSLAKRVAGLSLIREDLRAVKEMLARMDHHTQDFVGNKALLFGAVILYGKCFTQANGRGAKLDTKDVFASSNKRQSHERLMELRNEYVAHGGNDKEEQLKIILLLDPNKANKRFIQLVGHGASAHGFDEQARDKALETVAHVQAYVNRALEKTKAALMDELYTEGVERVYKHAIWPDS